MGIRAENVIVDEDVVNEGGVERLVCLAQWVRWRSSRYSGSCRH